MPTPTYYYANAYDGKTAHGSASIVTENEWEAREMARELRDKCQAPVTLYNGARMRIVARYK